MSCNYFMIGYRRPGLLPPRARGVDGDRSEGCTRRRRDRNVGIYKVKLPGRKGEGQESIDGRMCTLSGESETKYTWCIIARNTSLCTSARHTPSNISVLHICLTFYLRATRDRQRYRSTSSLHDDGDVCPTDINTTFLKATLRSLKIAYQSARRVSAKRLRIHLASIARTA